MADSKMAVSQWSPAFVQELLPAAQKTALLYHLSYLCLGKFTSLERTIRSRAVETRLLFGSSEATMFKCILTSNDLVQTRFPMLVTAVEKNKQILAVKFLVKAQAWIKDIVTDVENIVEKYDLHMKDVASATSDVVQEKDDTDKKITVQDQELKLAEQILNDMKSELQKTTAELAETEKKINSKSQEIQEFAKSISQTRNGLHDFEFRIFHRISYDYQVEHLKALEAELNILIADKTTLKQKQWQVQLQIIDWQMKVGRATFDRNCIPDPVYLEEVQKSLTKIQDILIQPKNFWKEVAQLLVSLERKTFAGEDLIEDLAELKDEFLDSIKAATEAWTCFGAGCQRASVIFKLQTKDAYKFLEVSPSSLSKEQWKIQYKRVKKQLEEIDPPV